MRWTGSLSSYLNMHTVVQFSFLTLRLNFGFIQLHDVILKKPGIKKDSERYSPIFETGSPALDLLKELGFEITDDEVKPPLENQYSLQAAQRVVFALWGTAKN